MADANATNDEGVAIQRHVHEAGGRYVATIAGSDARAELVYRRAGENRIIAEHTAVPDAFRGRGIGHLLVERMVEDARAEGLKITARCPFVKRERDRHPAWADAFEG